MGRIIDHTNSPPALPPNETRPPRTDDLRLMTLNVGGGAGNMIYESDGMDDPSSRALRDYVDVHGYTDAGDVGPTSRFGNGRRIDYIFTSSGITAGAPQRVEGDSPDKAGEDHDLSDHDGIAVMYSLP